MKLTASQVTHTNKAGRYGDGDGLYLRVAKYKLRDGSAAIAKGWVFRFARNGKERWMGLGNIRTRSLAEAREAARKCRQVVLDGGDQAGRGACVACWNVCPAGIKNVVRIAQLGGGHVDDCLGVSRLYFCAIWHVETSPRAGWYTRQPNRK